MIKVKEGQITSLSPLSGHYRTSIDVSNGSLYRITSNRSFYSPPHATCLCPNQHFKVFLEVLESRGADLHKVQRTKAEVALWGYVRRQSYLALIGEILTFRCTLCRLSRWKTFKKAQGAFVKDRKQDVKHVLHRSTSESKRPTKPAPKSATTRPSSDGDATPRPHTGDASGSKQNTTDSSQHESDDHSWLPENWRHAALSGRQKVKAKMSPTKKTSEEESCIPGVPRSDSPQKDRPVGPVDIASSSDVGQNQEGA